MIHPQADSFRDRDTRAIDTEHDSIFTSDDELLDAMLQRFLTYMRRSLYLGSPIYGGNPHRLLAAYLSPSDHPFFHLALSKQQLPDAKQIPGCGSERDTLGNCSVVSTF